MNKLTLFCLSWQFRLISRNASKRWWHIKLTFCGSLIHLLQIYFMWLCQTNSSIGNNHYYHVFPVAGSHLWNSLLCNVTSAPTLTFPIISFLTVGPGHPSYPLSIYFLIFSFSFIGFTNFFLLSIPSLSTRIVPLRFQAAGHRKWPNLGLVVVFNLCYLYSLVKMDSGVLFCLV